MMGVSGYAMAFEILMSQTRETSDLRAQLVVGGRNAHAQALLLAMNVCTTRPGVHIHSKFLRPYLLQRGRVMDVYYFLLNYIFSGVQTVEQLAYRCIKRIT